MKKVRVDILNKGLSDYFLKIDGDNIVIETSDIQGLSDLWELSKWLSNSGKIDGFYTENGEIAKNRFILIMKNGFNGVIEGTYILTRFKAADLISK